MIRTVGRAMSRVPRAYVGWGEEDRRQAFLLMLNSHYACQTYAETFIASGRTDLLFSADDGATPSGLPAPDWQAYVTVAL